ncbi:MAG: Flp pilus assembly protein CpaB [Deltaproteobacteria bacterium RIFCSPLOWO2_12_FULL_57_22]|nr:MAG: Flp pilus assembly protein CpaB [Deltaproteobacteria bacterium RIFCSPLOWO2_12_FULL_57_22]
MVNRLRIAIIAAIFFGLIAAYGVYSFLRQQREATEALKSATQNVVVAAKEIPAGTNVTEKIIKEGLVKETSWPKASVPPGSFYSTNQVVGKTVKTKVVAGEPILESKLVGEGVGLATRLAAGYRAVAVKVDEVIGVSGFIAPDDRVDVIATLTPPGRGSQDEKLSKIVLQNRRVLSVAQSVEQKEGKPQVVRSITLEVTPEEAEKLSLAVVDGHVILALRAIGDEAAKITRGSTKRDLLALAAPSVPRRKAERPPAAPPVSTEAPPQKYRVEVYRGSQKSVVEF